jgi:pimeloyl-ACP methyl ester carboxylesterase
MRHFRGSLAVIVVTAFCGLLLSACGGGTSGNGPSSCTPGTACTPTGTSNACKTYATACDASGTQTCVVASDRLDGTTCGGANTCAAGLCQAPCASATVKVPATGSPAWSADFVSWMNANGFAHVAANQGFGGGTACSATGRDPVVLLHGNSNSADPTTALGALKSKFVAGGYTDCDLFAITWIEQSAALGDNHHKASYMKLVRDLVDAVKGYRGKAKVDVVAWSMGVGIARKAMQGGIAYSDPARTLGCDLGPSMSASVDTLVGVAGVARGYVGCTNTSNSCSPNGYSVDSSFLQDVNGGKAGTYAPAPVASHIYSIYLPDDEFLCGDNPLGRGPIACEVYGTHSSIVPGSEFSRAYDLFNENYGNNFGLNFNCTTDAFGKAVNCDHVLVMNDAFSLDAIVRMVRDNETATLPPPPFAQADLAGAWDIVVHTSNDAAIWQAASVTIDGGGLMTFTSYVDSMGTTTAPGPGQTFIIDANGIVTTTGAGAVPSLHGMLSAQKTLLVGTMTFPGTPSSYGLFVLRKRVNGVTFSSADVANLAFDFHQILSGGGTVWEYGLGSTNASGALTIASVMTPAGPGTPPAAGSGTLQISPAGLVSLTADTTFHGVMTADKKAVFGVGTRSGTIPSPYFTTLLLTGQSFAQADLNAVWEFHLLTSGANLAASNWFYGRLSIVSPGTVTTRYGLAPSGATLPAIGPLSLAPDGTITSSGNATYHGRMSWGKDFYVRTQTTSGASSLSLVVK